MKLRLFYLAIKMRDKREKGKKRGEEGNVKEGEWRRARKRGNQEKWRCRKKRGRKTTHTMSKCSTVCCYKENIFKSIVFKQRSCVCSILKTKGLVLLPWLPTWLWEEAPLKLMKLLLLKTVAGSLPSSFLNH